MENQNQKAIATAIAFKNVADVLKIAKKFCERQISIYVAQQGILQITDGHKFYALAALGITAFTDPRVADINDVVALGKHLKKGSALELNALENGVACQITQANGAKMNVTLKEDRYFQNTPDERIFEFWKGWGENKGNTITFHNKSAVAFFKNAIALGSGGEHLYHKFANHLHLYTDSDSNVSAKVMHGRYLTDINLRHKATANVEKAKVHLDKEILPIILKIAQVSDGDFPCELEWKNLPPSYHSDERTSHVLFRGNAGGMAIILRAKQYEEVATPEYEPITSMLVVKKTLITEAGALLGYLKSGIAGGKKVSFVFGGGLCAFHNTDEKTVMELENDCFAVGDEIEPSRVNANDLANALGFFEPDDDLQVEFLAREDEGYCKVLRLGNRFFSGLFAGVPDKPELYKYD